MTSLRALGLQPEIRNLLPTVLKEGVGRARRRYREQKADLEFLRRDLPDVSASDDAPQHVVCVVVDALRADMIDQEITTFLNDIGGTTAVAAAPWTFPSVSSILTGQYPHQHGAIRQSDNPDNATEAEITLPPALPDAVPTLPEFFGGAGYDTFGAFGFVMPFLAMKDRFRTHSLFVNAAAPPVVDSYLNWLNGRENHRTFAYLHLADLHTPVNPPAAYWQKHDVDRSLPDICGWQYTEHWAASGAEEYQSNRKQLYRAAVDFVDDELADLAVALERDLSDTTLVVTSDHGEAFWEHAAFDAERFYDSRPAYCVGHGGTPYESISRVPLLSDSLAFDDGLTSLVDLAPTLLNEAGIDVPASIDGHIHGLEPQDGRVILIEGARYGYEKKAMYKGNWKLLISLKDGQSIGFKLPDETHTELPTAVESELQNTLPEWPSGREYRRVTGDIRTQLENLGYR